VSTTAVNRWPDAEHAIASLATRDSIPHRAEGCAVLLEALEVLDAVPGASGRVLDLGTGDGVMVALVRSAWPDAEAVAVDFSPAMLEAARARFEGDAAVEVVSHDLDRPLPDLGRFDAVISSFAIHHLVDGRKRALYGEILDRLVPGGVFVNLEHVASPTAALHEEFLAALGVAPGDEDPSNKLAPLDEQLAWLRDLGFVDVDCLWKWRELAILMGRAPT
jgi:SAM-dependent methyltransferase